MSGEVLLHPALCHAPRDVADVERETGRRAVIRGERVELIVPSEGVSITVHASGDADEATLDAILEIAGKALDWRL